jgi:hypothetical protein
MVSLADRSAENERRRRLDRPVAVGGVDVGVTEPRGLDPDDHLALTSNRRGNLLDDERPREILDDRGPASSWPQPFERAGSAQLAASSASSASTCRVRGRRSARPLLGSLLGVLGVLLGLVDSLPELVTGLGGGSLHRRLGRRDALLELVDSCGEVHASSLGCADYRSELLPYDATKLGCQPAATRAPPAPASPPRVPREISDQAVPAVVWRGRRSTARSSPAR